MACIEDVHGIIIEIIVNSSLCDVPHCNTQLFANHCEHERGNGWAFCGRAVLRWPIHNPPVVNMLVVIRKYARCDNSISLYAELHTNTRACCNHQNNRSGGARNFMFNVEHLPIIHPAIDERIVHGITHR